MCLLHYLPQYNEHLEIMGAGVLIRWQHPEIGVFITGEFMPVAVESYLILVLSEWVIVQVNQPF